MSSGNPGTPLACVTLEDCGAGDAARVQENAGSPLLKLLANGEPRADLRLRLIENDAKKALVKRAHAAEGDLINDERFGSRLRVRSVTTYPSSGNTGTVQSGAVTRDTEIRFHVRDDLRDALERLTLDADSGTGELSSATTPRTSSTGKKKSVSSRLKAQRQAPDTEATTPSPRSLDSAAITSARKRGAGRAHNMTPSTTPHIMPMSSTPKTPKHSRRRERARALARRALDAGERAVEGHRRGDRGCGAGVQAGESDACYRELRDTLLLSLESKADFDRYNVRPIRGILLHGAPGTGKTTMVKRIAAEAAERFLGGCTVSSAPDEAMSTTRMNGSDSSVGERTGAGGAGVSLMLVNSPDVMNGSVVEMETNLDEIFRLARRSSPCILFIDEIDVIASTADGDSVQASDGAAPGTSEASMSSRICHCLCRLLDGETTGSSAFGNGGKDAEEREGDDEGDVMNGDENVVVVGATNRLEMIHSIIRRQGASFMILNPK